VVVALAITCAVVGVLRHLRAYGGALAEQAAQLAARTDPLTGVLNRRGHDEALDAAMAAAGPFFLVVVDLDGFKAINDTHGHDVGDRTLIDVAHRLRASLRPDDTIARLGGDEFAVLCAGDARAGERVAAKVCDALRGPYAVGHLLVPTSGSVGVAAYPQDADNPASLTRRADRAMYTAKRARQGWARWAPDEVPSTGGVVPTQGARVPPVPLVASASPPSS
jgi:diguanylate cyclase (GGDEF)-like protein